MFSFFRFAALLLCVQALEFPLKQAKRKDVVARQARRALKLLAPRASPVPCPSPSVQDTAGACCPESSYSTATMLCCPIGTAPDSQGTCCAADSLNPEDGFCCTTNEIYVALNYTGPPDYIFYDPSGPQGFCCQPSLVYKSCLGNDCCFDGEVYADLDDSGTETKGCCDNPLYVVRVGGGKPDLCCYPEEQRAIGYDGEPSCCFEDELFEPTPGQKACCRRGTVYEPTPGQPTCCPGTVINTRADNSGESLCCSDNGGYSTNAAGENFCNVKAKRALQARAPISRHPASHLTMLNADLTVEYLRNEGIFHHDGEEFVDQYARRQSQTGWKRALLSAGNTILPYATKYGTQFLSRFPDKIASGKPLKLSPRYGFFADDIPEIYGILAADNFTHINHAGLHFTREMIETLAGMHPNYNSSDAFVGQFRK